jgi:hypothetical protein
MSSLPTGSEPSALQKETRTFFERLSSDDQGRKLLSELDHSIEFCLIDWVPFCLRVEKGRVLESGITTPQRLDVEDVIHFQLSSATLRRLLAAEIRFTDALIPTDPDANDVMLLLECTLFKWSVLSWVGRMFRGAQVRAPQH